MFANSPQHIRLNHLQVQFKRRQDLVQKAWEEQVQEKRDKGLEQEKLNEEERLREEGEMRRKEELAKEESVQRRLKIDEWKSGIEDQLKELDGRHTEEETLKQEISFENQRLKELEEADKKRKLAEERRRQNEFGDFLKRQHRIKMLAKARQVEEELKEDQKILDELKSFVKSKDDEENKKATEARTKQLEWLEGVLTHQKEEEAKRRRQMDHLFTEEAKKMWDKQEKIWQTENEARKKLMEDVLKTLNEQTKTKLKEKEKRKEEVLLDKQILKESIDKLKVDVENEEKKDIEKRTMFVEDLDKQVEEKMQKEKMAKDQKAMPEKDRMRLEMMWDQRVRDRNELATKLSKWSFSQSDSSVITVRHFGRTLL